MVRSDTRLLREVGGNFNANGDYSVTPGIFFVAPPPGLVFELLQFSVWVRDLMIRSSRYGNSNITNGVELLLVKNPLGPITLIRDLLDGVPIDVTSKWGFFAEIAERQSWGGGDETFFAHYESTGDSPPLLLRGSRNEALLVRLSDDFTGLDEHFFSAVIRISIDQLLNSSS